MWEWLDVAHLHPMSLPNVPRLFDLSHLGLVGVPDLGNGVGWVDCNPLDHDSNRDGGIAATLG